MRAKNVLFLGYGHFKRFLRPADMLFLQSYAVDALEKSPMTTNFLPPKSYLKNRDSMTRRSDDSAKHPSTSSKTMLLTSTQLDYNSMRYNTPA
jgi:hypothetical protein